MHKEEYHEIVGGRLSLGNRAWEDKYDAPTIRGLIVDIRKNTGMTNAGVAVVIGVSGGTLSRAAHGKAGIKKRESGISTTEYIRNGLDHLHSFTQTFPENILSWKIIYRRD